MMLVRGIGGLGSETCAQAQDAWGLLGMLVTPDCWSSVAANTYSAAQYGSTPLPAGIAPPAAPQTRADMTTPGAWTVDQAIAGSMSNTAANQAAVYDAAVKSGAYDPTGILPVNATGLNLGSSNMGTWLIVGGAALLLVVMVKRR